MAIEEGPKGVLAILATGILALECIMSQPGQTHFKNLAAFAARFIECVWPFWDIMH